MASVVLVDPRGNTRSVDSLREFIPLVVNGAWLPTVGTVAEAFVTLGGSPPPDPPQNGAGGSTITRSTDPDGYDVLVVS